MTRKRPKHEKLLLVRNCPDGKTRFGRLTITAAHIVWVSNQSRATFFKVLNRDKTVNFVKQFIAKDIEPEVEYIFERFRHKKTEVCNTSHRVKFDIYYADKSLNKLADGEKFKPGKNMQVLMDSKGTFFVCKHPDDPYDHTIVEPLSNLIGHFRVEWKYPSNKREEDAE